MTSTPGAPDPDDTVDTVDAVDSDDIGETDDVYDLDGDGEVSTLEAERARLGLVDARLEEIADKGGIKGHLADAAHKLIDKLDND
jgi:hypothetical protein